MHALDSLILADVETGAIVVCRKVCMVFVWERPSALEDLETETAAPEAAGDALEEVAL